MRAWWIAALLLAGCTDGSTPDDVTIDDGLKATATTGVIRGVVVDQALQPIAGASVVLRGTSDAVTTTELGTFGFDDVPPGDHFVEATKPGYAAAQTSVSVVAGVDRPDATMIRLEQLPGLEPAIVPTKYAGFLTCGVAIVLTSVGCTTLAAVADATGASSIFRHEFAAPTIQHSQGELIWTSTQPLGGAFIWEITGRTNDHLGYRETTTSPALAYINASVFAENPNDIITEGVDYRFFAGPHEVCTTPPPVPNNFGCGATINQQVEIVVHDFYNFSPDEGWRYTAHGEHPLP